MERILRRPLAMLAVLAGVVGATLGVARPAHADDTFVYVEANFDIAVSFGGNDTAEIKRAIEAAKREILAEIAASEKRILDYIDQNLEADITTCVRTSSGDLVDVDTMDPVSRRLITRAIDECANRAGILAGQVQNLGVADRLAVAMAEVQAISAVFHAKAGVEMQGQLANFISDFEVLFSRLTPACTYRDLQYGGFRTREHTCTAYNGEFARGSEHWRGNGQGGWDPWIPPGGTPFNLEAVKEQAAANTNWRLVKQSLPLLRTALDKLRRDLVVCGVQFGQVTFWEDDGPLIWDILDHPLRANGAAKEATAVATALDTHPESKNRRHLLAVFDGGVHHRIRNQNGSWSPWVSIGNHPGTASAVAAADAAGQLHVLAVVDGQIHHRMRGVDGSWTPWTKPGDTPGTATAVAAAVDGASRLHVLAVVDGKVRHRIRHGNGAWTEFTPAGHGGTATGVTALFDGTNVQVAAVIDGQLHHKFQVDDNWTLPWNYLGNPGTATAVAGAVDPNGDAQFTLIIDDEAYQRTRFAAAYWTERWVKHVETIGTSAVSAS
ncbi:hypothetical protein [Virgisporangium aurantiacum]|uniref:Uncharacterized protein n=1 Tax=Virgisporangium aurantiacum TaxID=175570 RepID=A0A8J3ZHP5_9ACTN|nr:hypothetical protein [Virgisporangium aurantiacum]GIJ64109.1 hypothetical protein Vau01_116250 [Virgisporangium aurantiacum]